MKRAKKEKRKKLTSIPVIHRRLFRLASILCRERANFTCEICGKKQDNTKKIRIEAHHVMSRSNKNCPLKYDLRNLCALCTSCHKFSKYSAHKHGLWFAKWFFENKPTEADFILNNSDIEVDLNDSNTLKYMEECLKNNIIFDYKKIMLTS
jgi:hypothetical protein